MIKSAVTISLVPEARGGPFVFWDDLESACRKAAELGFDGIEVFAPDAETLQRRELRQLLDEHDLELAAAGTGAGWVKHKLTLTSPDPSIRQAARSFVRSVIDAAGALRAPAIIGSMQGRWGGEVARDDAFHYLAEALEDLGEHARRQDVRLLFEPLNRYETNLVNTIGSAVELLQSLSTKNVKLLADLFHMNIEERSIRDALYAGTGHIGHVHFADSNRRAVGWGHINARGVGHDLKEINFEGFVSAEALPFPDPDQAAQRTASSFRQLLEAYQEPRPGAGGRTRA